uniref:Uncharacterized protein n=1 Tax=Nelumbo nucifera TaxID=4432 RepID=A0A822YME1_NELNU|nr:TPA_asm: hypothetical protein HUJ06_005994 [Nelumbo nucifera]
MVRKRNRDEEGYRKATKSHKFNSEWDVKALLGVAGKKIITTTARNSVQKGTEGVVGKVGEEVKRFTGDSSYSSVPGNSTLEGAMGWDEDLPWFSSLVEEQALWGWLWFPEWETEFYAVQNELVWDDDIWQLKDIKEIPNPSKDQKGR